MGQGASLRTQQITLEKQHKTKGEKMRLIRVLTLLILSLFLLTACQKENSNILKIGTITGPETLLMDVAKEVAKNKYGLEIDVVEFSDYSIPNTVLADGSIDANMFQHLPYLIAANKAHGYDLVSIAKTFVYPMGIYSDRMKSLKDIPNGAKVAIPNDPSNEARALLLLEKAGLISLKEGAGINATPMDVASNPHQFSFKELDAAQLPRVLPDVDLAVINTNFAVPAGLTPSDDALFLEDKDSPYANIVVVRKADKTDPRFTQLIDALHSEEVLQKAKELFHGQAIQAW